MHDNLVKAWAAWGDYLDQLFSTEKYIDTIKPIVILCLHCRSQTLALSAMTCYLHACRNQDEPKSRKYLARILWLLTYDDEKVCTQTILHVASCVALLRLVHVLLQ